MMIQAMHMEYSFEPHPTYQDYRGHGNYGGNENYLFQGGHGAQYGEVVMVAIHPLI